MITILLGIGIYYWAFCTVFMLGSIVGFHAKSGWSRVTAMEYVAYGIGLLASGVLVPFMLGSVFNDKIIED